MRYLEAEARYIVLVKKVPPTPVAFVVNYVQVAQLSQRDRATQWDNMVQDCNCETI